MEKIIFNYQLSIFNYKKSLPPKRTTGISSFEILLLLFSGLLVEHKLYITLLLILMSLVLPHGVLTFPLFSDLKDGAMDGS